MSNNQSIPHHVAIVMDGNGRWAKKRFLPRAAGHKEGVKAARNTIESCGKAGVKILTLFAFSSENWKRPETEVNALMDLFISSLEKEIKKLRENGVRLQFIGDRLSFSNKLQEKIQEAETLTANNKDFVLNIAANYGGRWDVVQACQSLCRQVQEEKLSIENINEEVFAQQLSTQSLPDPDLFIRTAGEQRVSNFLIWQMAYSEFYYTDVFWPDFDEQQLKLALESYARRKRKFGLTQEQIESGIHA